LTFIAFQEINSVLTAWGTDGHSVYQLFAQPSVNFVKRAVTKLWDKPGGYQMSKFVNRFWAIVQYFSSLAPEVDVSIDTEAGSTAQAVALVPNIAVWFTLGGLVSTWVTALAQPSTWISPGGQFSVSAPAAVGQSGVLIGFTLTTSAADMSLVSAMIQPAIAGNRG
jgi:hypothetical protein